MNHGGSRAFLAPGAFCIATAIGLLVWLLVLAVAGPGSSTAARAIPVPAIELSDAAVESGSGRAALADSGLWLHVLVTAPAFFLAALVLGTAMSGSSASPLALGLATAPVLLPLILWALSPDPPPASRGRSENVLYYGIVFHALLGAATFFPAFGGARLAEFRREVLDADGDGGVRGAAR